MRRRVGRNPMGDTSPAHAERRRSARKLFRKTAYLLFAGHPPIPVRTLDLSVHGLSVVGAVNPSQHATCVCQFGIPVMPAGNFRIEVQATVVESILSGSDGGFRIGLQFSTITTEVSEAIKKFLAA